MRHVATLVFLVTTIAVYGLLGQLKWREGPFLYFFVTGALAFLVILIHELGHALAAKAYGRQVLRFVVMPFELRFRPLRFRLAHLDQIGGDIGGFVVYGGRLESRRERALISFAGPAANFLLAGGALLLAGWLAMRPDTSHLPAIVPAPLAGPPAPDAYARLLPSDAEVAKALESGSLYFGQKPLGAILCEALAALSIGTGFANLIPFKGSDGDLIFRALFRGRSRA